MMKPISNTSSVVPADKPESHKRKGTEEENGSRSSKKARTRVSYSCGECHRRKQKCNRQVPCSHCVARKVPELCKAYSPGKLEQGLHARLARIEHVLEVALPQYWSPAGFSHYSGDGNGGRKRSISSGLDDENMSATEEQDLVGGTFQRGSWFGNSASGAIASASVLKQLQHVVSPNSASASPEESGIDTSPESALKPGLAAPAPESFAADNLKTLIQDCGVSPHKMSELMHELPPKFLASDLIDYYFSAINWTRYPLPEEDFRASYASLSSSGLSTHPNDVRFLPLLFVVLAISVRLSPERLGGDAKTRRLTSLRYYWSSRRSLLIVAAIQPDCLEMIWTRLLSARFLTFDRRITECWSQLGAAVSTAQSLGLHRDGATMRMDPTQVENRRRIWANLYHADRSFALILGRPMAIKDEYTSTKVPLNLGYDLSMLSADNPPPLTTPTPMSFVILRHALSVIMGGMIHHFQQVQHPSHYSDVGKLDDELLNFMNNLPPYFAMEPDISFDKTHPYIPAHRFLLITEVLFVRIALHRPYILRRLDSDRYLRSRNACFESALKDFEVRNAFRRSVSKETRKAVAIAYREIQAVMISAIYLVLNPNGKDSAAMLAILDAFLLDHREDEEMDETTLREVKTIQFLKSKGLRLAAAPSDKTTPSGLDPNSILSVNTELNSGAHSEAQLLLGLQGAADRPRQPPNPFPQNSSYDPLQPSPLFGLDGSPTVNDSPVEDDSTAQSLFDHWYNTFGQGSGVDGPAGAAELPLNPGNDSSGWPLSSSLFGSDSQVWNGSSGSDLSYWENLIDQIRGAPT